MSTYITGVTDYIPEIQPFQPDYNFYMNVLQAKQNQYDTNYNKISSTYGELYNNPVTREDSNKMKDDYLKKIDFELKRVSGLDLSLEQNVNQAVQVFKPFYENNHLMKDMALTKNYNRAVGNAMSLANSKDEKVRGTYWDAGIKAMQYRLDEFKNADASEVLSFSNINYTPYANAQKKFLDMAKEYNLSVDITQPDKSGMYFIRQKNGELLLPSLQKLFMNAYVNDPELQKVYATQAYVNRKDEIELRSKNFNNDKVAAEKDFLQEQYRHLKGYVSQQAAEANDSYTVTKNKNNSVENNRNQGDVHPKQSSYLQRLQQTLQVESFVKTHADKMNEDINGQSYTVSTQGPNQSIGGLDLNNMELARNKVDSAYANLLAERDINAASEIYANKDRIYDLKVNPIGLESMRHANNMQRDAVQNAFTMQRDKMKYDFDIAKTKDNQEFELKLAQAKNKQDKKNMYNQHLLDIGAAYYDKDGSLKIKDNNQKTDPFAPMSTTNNKINFFKAQKEHLFGVIDSDAAGYIGTFVNTIQSGIEGSNPEISKKELAEILGTTPDKAIAEFKKIKNDYYSNKGKVVRDLTLSGKIFNFKSKMDRWSYANDGTSISRSYLSSSEAIDKIEDVQLYFRAYNDTKKQNYKTIQNSLVSTLNGANLSEQANKEILKLYNEKYLQGKIDADKFEELVEDFIIGRLDKKGKGLGKGPQTKMVTKTRTDEFGVTEKYTESVPTHETNGAAILKLLNETFNNTIKNGDPKTGMTSVFHTIQSGKGDRSYAAYPSSIDVNLGWKGSDGYQFFAQTVEDLNKISFSNADGMHGISLDGANKLDDDKYVAPENIMKYKRLVNDLLYNASKSQKGNPTQFKLTQHQIAMENEKVGAMTVTFPREFLEKQIKDGDYKIDAGELERIYKNGITFMAPHTSWKNNMFNSNKIDATQGMINMKGHLKYVHPENAGNYIIEHNPQDNTYRYNVTYNLIDGEGNLYQQKETKSSMEFGNNFKTFKQDLLKNLNYAKEFNLEKYKEFHAAGDTEKIAKVEKIFGTTPKDAGYSF
jgi:hypothetical protein